MTNLSKLKDIAKDITLLYVEDEEVSEDSGLVGVGFERLCDARKAGGACAAGEEREHHWDCVMCFFIRKCL